MKIFVEGKSEELYLKGALKDGKIKQKYLNNNFIEIVDIDINLVDSHIIFEQEDIIIIVADNDVESTNQKICDAVTAGSRSGINVMPLQQTPNFEFFICSHFADFTGLPPEILTIKEQNEYMEQFLKKKKIQKKYSHTEKEKVWAHKTLKYTKIKEAGGDYQLSKRFLNNNKILKILK